MCSTRDQILLYVMQQNTGEGKKIRTRQLFKDRITRGHRYYCTLAQCVNYQITKTRYTWVVLGSPDLSYLPGVKRSSVWTASPVHPSNVTTGKITFKSDIYPLIMDPILPTPSPWKKTIKKTSSKKLQHTLHDILVK